MLIHRQNSFAPRSWRSTGRREEQIRETGQQSNDLPCTFDVSIYSVLWFQTWTLFLIFKIHVV
jgi:hypothetical protein